MDNNNLIEILARGAGIPMHHAGELDLLRVAMWDGSSLWQRCPDVTGCCIFISVDNQEQISEYMLRITGRK